MLGVAAADPIESARRKEEKDFKLQQAEMYKSIQTRVNGRSYKPPREGLCTVSALSLLLRPHYSLTRPWPSAPPFGHDPQPTLVARARCRIRSAISHQVLPRVSLGLRSTNKLGAITSGQVYTEMLVSLFSCSSC